MLFSKYHSSKVIGGKKKIIHELLFCFKEINLEIYVKHERIVIEKNW